MRIWRHAITCEASTVLIYSPEIESDVCNIGLALPLTSTYTKQFIIQFNIPPSHEKKIINLNNFIIALRNDAHLACLPQNSLGKIMVSLFVGTGSDFTSYFKGIGKAQFLNIFFLHARFICGQDMPGSMEQVSMNNRASGFLSFLRLIGTAYFKKHLASFISVHNFETPHQLYNSTDPT